MTSVLDLIKSIIKGIVIGVANIIPGVSGGTMAVSMGVYDKLIEAVTSIKRNFKASFLFLLPFLAGAVVGIGLLSFVVRFTLDKYPLQTAGLFIGLILGGLPVILKKFKGAKLNFFHLLIFLIFFALIISMTLAGDHSSTAVDFAISPLMVIQLFGVGVIASATMIIPGVSGSLVMMILGFYNGIITNISNFIEAVLSWDQAAILHGLAVFIPLGLGIVFGAVLVAKIIAWLFKNAPFITYSAILGLIIASPIVLIIETGVSNISTVIIITTLLTFAAGFSISFLLSRGKDGEEKTNI